MWRWLLFGSPAKDKNKAKSMLDWVLSTTQSREVYVATLQYSQRAGGR
jgi:hypothetical protein